MALLPTTRPTGKFYNRNLLLAKDCALYVNSTPAFYEDGGIIFVPKNSDASALSGTQKDVQIDIGGVPYYFTVYPTKA